MRVILPSCAVKKISIISFCIFCWIHNYNNVYTVLYVLKSALVSLDCFCLVRTFTVTTKRPRYSSGALFCVTLAYSSQPMNLLIQTWISLNPGWLAPGRVKNSTISYCSSPSLVRASLDLSLSRFVLKGS